MIVATVVIIALIVALYATSAFWINWWWFDSVGYRSVLTTRYAAQALSFLLGALVTAGFFIANWRFALQRSRGLAIRPRAVPPTSRFVSLPLWFLSAAIFVVAGVAAANRWQTWLLFSTGGAFEINDPIFGRDAGFYVFTLPALAAVHRGALALLLVTAIVVVVLYAIVLGLDRVDLRNPPRRVRTHLLALAGGVLLWFGAGYLLANYRMLSSTRGFVYGVGFTDAAVVRWINYALVIISVVAAGLLLLNAFIPQFRWLLVAAGAWAVAAGLAAVLPAIVQQAIVEPNELRRERPYIAHNIALTRAGFDLDRVEMRNLTGQGVPPASALSPESPTLDNIRLWDYRIIQVTFLQLRSFVTYYVFNDVDVDRYELDGQLRQVLVSARELNVDGLAANAQTWVNRHLAYTHGYGAVVSPVAEATRQGLPIFLVGGIPPEGTGPLTIDRPEIYFGEVDGPWVAVNTAQPEISGISGETVTTPYEGAAHGSIRLDNYLRRVILSTYLGDRRILLSSELTDESRVLLRRTIVDRAEAIAPFLRYDPDPYLVIADGRLIWVIDAYSATDRFPGSTPTEGVNYIRHTVKVTIDAYDGTVTFYRTGIDDPIADAYGTIFGDLFRPIADAPASLAAHFRYPERLFDLQSEVYTSYHVTDPTAFYNGEDRWQIALEVIEPGVGPETGLRPMEAYYMTLPLPGEAEPGFGLIRPFTPNQRQNMTAWMAGQTDDAAIPRIVVYRFPRQVTVFGPQQIESLISQDPEVSTQTTLLGQAGTRVIRGNLLVIPIAESVLYVQPLYLQATEGEGAPTELKFVIVATNEQVEMRPTLAEALAALGGEAAPQPAPDALPAGDDQPSPVEISGEVSSLAEQALTAYERAQEALARGDWAAYGDEQANLDAILTRLVAETEPPPATPVP